MTEPTETLTPRPIRQEAERAGTEAIEVATNVLRMQLPIDFPGLGHVNCYAMEDERGFALVDPGMPGQKSWEAIQVRLKNAGIPLNRIHTIIVTHSHPDHYGGAERLRAETNADILTHESFKLFFEDNDDFEGEDSSALVLNDAEAMEKVRERFAHDTAWGTKRTPPNEEFLKQVIADRTSGGAFTTVTPTIRVSDGQPVMFAGREWQSIHTPGHTHDHLCLFDPTEGVMLSGDHVLPTITPHIGAWQPQIDPLAQFFSSLKRMTTFEGVTTVLPAHGHPFSDLAGRANHIIDHHIERLDTIRESVDMLGNANVNDHMKLRFKERSWGDMAESETFAHLVHLEELGEVVTLDQPGPTTFARA